MTACGAACTCNPDCPMVCTFERHHDDCTSPVGELRKLCESVGLIVRSKK